MKSKEKKQFNVAARIVVIAEKTISADNYEEALEVSKGLELSDFITVDVGHTDSSLRIASIGQGDMWRTDDY